MTIAPDFSDYAARLRRFIAEAAAEETGAGERTNEDRFNDLALELFELQLERNAAYRTLCAARGGWRKPVSHWEHIPAVPAGAFKEFELTSLPPAERTEVFHSSGTTGDQPSRHFHNAESLALYEASLLPWFQSHVLPEPGAGGARGAREAPGGADLVILTPPRTQAPHSSLVYMFEAVCREFGSPASLFGGTVEANGAWSLDRDRIQAALEDSVRAQRPAVLLGTAFNFVHLLDEREQPMPRCQLPSGSRAVETGGYKGRSRALSKVELRALIGEGLGIPSSHILGEYGMSELSSQAYDAVAGRTWHPAGQSRAFRFPPWARARIVSPETGREVEEGAAGLVQVFDLANLRSVLAMQTEDLGIRRGDGFELIGRVPAAEPRGCSLSAV